MARRARPRRADARSEGARVLRLRTRDTRRGAIPTVARRGRPDQREGPRGVLPEAPPGDAGLSLGSSVSTTLVLAPTSLVRRAPRVPLAASAAPVQPGAAEVGPGEIGGAQAHWTPPGGRRGSGRRGNEGGRGPTPVGRGSRPFISDYLKGNPLSGPGASCRLRHSHEDLQKRSEQTQQDHYCQWIQAWRPAPRSI